MLYLINAIFVNPPLLLMWSRKFCEFFLNFYSRFIVVCIHYSTSNLLIYYIDHILKIRRQKHIFEVSRLFFFSEEIFNSSLTCRRPTLYLLFKHTLHSLSTLLMSGRVFFDFLKHSRIFVSNCPLCLLYCIESSILASAMFVSLRYIPWTLCILYSFTDR